MAALGLSLGLPFRPKPAASGGGAPDGPDFLFVDGAIGGWYQWSPLSKLKQASAGTTDVASVSDPVGYWTGWNSSPGAIIQDTSGNKPEYDGASILFDGQSTRKFLANSETTYPASPQDGWFVYAARIVPKVNGVLRIGRWRSGSLPDGTDSRFSYGVKLNAGGAVIGVCQANQRTHGTGWTVDNAITVAVVGNGSFGSTSVYVNTSASALGLFTSAKTIQQHYGIEVSSGSFQVEKAVLLSERTSTITSQEISDLFDYLNVEV